MMHRLWLERPLPQTFVPIVQDRFIVLGDATQNPADKLAKLSDAHAIIAAARIRYDATVLDIAPHLKVIARTGVGYDNIDLGAASERGIAVCNVPDGPTRSTAEHAIALLFAVSRELRVIDQKVRNGGVQDFFSISNSIELHNKTLGLVGYGRIGRCVAQLATGIGMQVQVYDPYLSAGLEDAGVRRLESLDDLLGSSDAVSLHVPLSPATTHLIDEARITQMKPGAILINCSRGGVVDESALYSALSNGHLAGAGVDVFESEPPDPDHPLLGLWNVIATPHVAAATDACKRALWEGALTQVFDVCVGRKPAHLVNPEVWEKHEARNAVLDAETDSAKT